LTLVETFAGQALQDSRTFILSAVFSVPFSHAVLAWSLASIMHRIQVSGGTTILNRSVQANVHPKEELDQHPQDCQESQSGERQF
jgi:hypothetical protein